MHTADMRTLVDWQKPHPSSSLNSEQIFSTRTNAMSARRRFEALTPPILHRFDSADEEGTESLQGRPTNSNLPVSQFLHEVNEWPDGEHVDDLCDLSSQAVWTASSAKPGNGVEKLLDGQDHTFWQSDGTQPHTVSLQFVRKVKLKELRIFLNYAADESYTPSKIEVKVGSYYHDLRTVCPVKVLNEPIGWTVISLCGDEDDREEDNAEVGTEERKEKIERRKRRAYREWLTNLGRGCVQENTKDFIRVHMLQIIIHSNHQNGRDSHIRQVQILGPAQQTARNTSRFSSVDFQMHEKIR